MANKLMPKKKLNKKVEWMQNLISVLAFVLRENVAVFISA